MVNVEGNNLAGATSVRLVNSRLAVDQVIAPLANLQPGSFQFTIPNPPPDLPAGVYVLSAQVPSGSDVLSTNSLALVIAPTIATSWAPGTIGAGANVTVTVPCAPDVRPSQEASLIIGRQQAPADSFSTPTNSPSFTFATLESTGGQAVPVRLRVDGIDSPIIDLTVPDQPVFSGPTVQVV